MQETKHESFIKSLSAHYVQTNLLTVEESTEFTRFFRAVVAGDFAEFNRLLSVYRQFPEDGTLVLGVLTHTVGRLIHDYGCCFAPFDGMLFFRFVSRPGYRSIFDRHPTPGQSVTPPSRHNITFSVATGAVEGFEEWLRDDLIEQVAWGGQAESGEAAFGHLSVALDKGIAHYGADQKYSWLDRLGMYIEGHRKAPQAVKAERARKLEHARCKAALEVEMAPYKQGNRLVYWVWRRWNRKRLEGFDL